MGDDGDGAEDDGGNGRSVDHGGTSEDHGATMAKDIVAGDVVSLFAAAAGCHHSGFASVSLCAALVLMAIGRCRWFLKVFDTPSGNDEDM